jgi:hypothetical protein
LWNFLALDIQGDLADYTCYVSKRGDVVFFPKHPPEVPKSISQAWRRELFRQAAQTWQMKTSEAKANWEKASQRAHLKCTGYNLWTFFYVTENEAVIRTIEHQTGVTLL